jgi:hypothetical protein
MGNACKCTTRRLLVNVDSLLAKKRKKGNGSKLHLS